VKKEQFYLRQGEELIRVYGKGKGAVKAFCVNCGSSLFGGDWPDGPEVSIRMGAFDDDPGIRPQFHTFVDDRAPWDEITDDLPQYRARFDGEHAGDFEMKQYSSGETATRETSSLQLLDDLFWQPSATAIIEPIVSRVAAQLRADLNAPLAWEPVPLHAYGGKLPSFIRSSWVFVLRGNNSASGAERHPNSHQRVMSYRGEGDLQIKIDKEWQSHFLSSDRSAAFEARWVSIPPNTWHQAVVSGADWVVVSFHTVGDSELIEERPDEKNPDSTRQRKYLE